MGKKQKLKKARQASIAIEEVQLAEKNSLFWVVFIGLCILMLYPPFFRGLYFSREFLPTHAFSALLFVLWWVYKLSVKKDTSFLTGPLDYAVLGLVLAYAVSLVATVNIRSALGELLKNVNYFIAFWMAAEMTKELKKPHILLNILLSSAVLVALLGIGAAAGTFNYRGAFEAGRIYSSLQYPNTLATYLTAAYFISMTLLLNCEHKWGRYIYPSINFTLFFVFIFTYSRGAWLAFPLIMIIYLIGVSREKRIRGIVYFILTLIPAILCLQGFSSAISGGAQLKAWLWYIIGAALTIALTALSRLSAKYVSGINKKVAIAAVGAGIVVLAVLAGVILNAREPIRLAHSADEEDSWKTVRREISGIKPDTDYDIVLDIESKNPDEKQYSWRIVIQSIDNKGEAVNILTHTGSETDGVETKELLFSTITDTKKIRINFYNRFSNTHAVYDNINIYEGEDRSDPIPVMTSYKYIPESIVERLSRINLQESSAARRLEFYGDAFKIIKDYPIFGAGGGGWSSLYQGYQSSLYWTTEVHSYFLQLWVETGTLGFLVICAVWLILFYEVFKFVRRKEVDVHDKDYLWGAFVGAFALGAHSVIDFNLSLGAVALYLWFLIGTVSGTIANCKEDVDTKTKKKRSHSLAPAKYYLITIIPSVLIIAVSLSLLIGEVSGDRGRRYLQEAHLSEALKTYETAIRFDPLKSVDRVGKAQVLEFMAKQAEDASFTERAREEYEIALKYDSHNAELHSAIGFFYLKIGETVKGLEHIEKAIELHPYLIGYYEQKAYAYNKLIEYMIENENPHEAAEYIQKTLSMVEDIRLLNKNSSGTIETTYRFITDMEKLAFISNNIGNSRIHRVAEKIMFATTQMFDTANNDLPDLWKKANTNEGLMVTKIKEEGNERVLRVENQGQGLSYIYTADFPLEPNRGYLLTFKARSNIRPESFRVSVRSRSGKSVQGAINSIKTTEEWQEYELEVLTTEDIEYGNQYIRIEHRGNDDGYFDIKDIMLTEW